MARNKKIEGVRMKRNKRALFCLVGGLWFSALVSAQDPLPASLKGDRPFATISPLADLSSIQDTVEVYVSLPHVFRNTGENYIDDPAGILYPIWERMRTIRRGTSNDTLRIVHIGDSHVRGAIFPRTAGDLLTYAFGTTSYTEMGVNGATCLTFTHADRINQIAALRPELIIFSFGTNESHNRRYQSMVHYRQIDELVRLVREKIPDVAILLTTPPGSYEGYRGRRRTSALTINPRTAVAAKTICEYAREKGLAVWNMYTVVGGEKDACRNWKTAKLLRPDHVHYLPEGYKLQGELLFEALINSYNEYVTR